MLPIDLLHTQAHTADSLAGMLGVQAQGGSRHARPTRAVRAGQRGLGRIHQAPGSRDQLPVNPRGQG